jgi:hypothetical protein
MASSNSHRLTTMNAVPFRHSQLHHYKMLKASLYFTRSGRGRAHDDVIHISENESSRELFDIVYKTPELRRSKRFTMPEKDVKAYLSNLIRMMSHDSDPFENLQLTTAIQPSIFFHMADAQENVYVLLEMISTALRVDVESE